jgi:uncharacterized membrane protein YfcA
MPLVSRSWIASIPRFVPGAMRGAWSGMGETVGARRIIVRVLRWMIVAALILGAMIAQIPEHYAALLSGADINVGLTMVAIFAGSLAAGLAGFAFSAIAGALVLHWLTPSAAVPLLLACSVTTQVVSITRLWRTMQWTSCVPFLIGGLAGIPAGAMLLRALNPHAFALGFGAFLVCYSGYMLARPGLTVQTKSALIDGLAGFGGGVLGGAIAFPGAIPTMWCNLQGLPKETQRGTIQPFILVMQLATLLYFSRLDMLGAGLGSIYLLCAPIVLLGTWIGLHFFDRVKDKGFQRVVLIFLLLSGIALAL